MRVRVGTNPLDITTESETRKKSERYLPKHVWYLADALLLVRELQAAVWPLGWHVAVGGGVLNHGYSDKDLDIYVLPIYRDETPHDDSNIADLGIALAQTLGLPVNDLPATLVGAPRHECFRAQGEYDYYDGKSHRRVDVFMVAP